MKKKPTIILGGACKTQKDKENQMVGSAHVPFCPPTLDLHHIVSKPIVIRYIDKRVAELERASEKLSQDSAGIKAHIKLVLEV